MAHPRAGYLYYRTRTRTGIAGTAGRASPQPSITGPAAAVICGASAGKTGETGTRLARDGLDQDYSERRKFRTSCFWLVDSELKLAITVLASEPLPR